MKYKINDQIPDSEVFQLVDGNPKKFQINDFFKDNKSILLGMPGAFTSVCSNKHLPSYKDNIDKIRSKGVDKVFCVSVNDPYVMDAWAKISKVENEIIMLADPFGDFDLIFSAAYSGQKILEYPVHYRSRKYGSTQISRFKDGWKLLSYFMISLYKFNVSK